MQLSYDEDLIYRATDVANDLIKGISDHNDVKFNFAISLGKLEDGIRVDVVDVAFNNNSGIEEFDVLVDITHPLLSEHKEYFKNDNEYIISVLCVLIRSILEVLASDVLNKLYNKTSLDDYICDEMNKRIFSEQNNPNDVQHWFHWH